jgi:hypothetical protein
MPVMMVLIVGMVINFPHQRHFHNLILGKAFLRVLYLYNANMPS